MKTLFARKLYDDLMNLVNDEDSSFYFVDQEIENQKFRIFNYRLASYTEFLKPNALNCRGTMFYLTEDNQYNGLAALTPSKFFNDSENPMTMDIDYSQTDIIMDKMDGSLMTTYDPFFNFHNVQLKSKGSLHSEQAVAATKLLYSEKYQNLLEYLKIEQSYGNSVSLEYTAPDNMIVIAYPEPRLTVLEVRSMITGNEVSYRQIKQDMTIMKCEEFLVKTYTPDDFVSFVQSIPELKDDIEGYVVRLSNGMKVKIKTSHYLSIHRLLDNINSPRRLFEAVVNETTDDVKAKFHENVGYIERILNMEEKVRNVYSLVDKANEFVSNNSSLDKKEFALKCIKELIPFQQTIAFNTNNGKPFDLKEYIIKRYKDFGIIDEDTVEIE